MEEIAQVLGELVLQDEIRDNEVSWPALALVAKPVAQPAAIGRALDSYKRSEDLEA